MRRVRRWLDTHRVKRFLALLGFTVALYAVLDSVSGDLMAAQRATTLDGLDLDRVWNGIRLDYAFMVAYAALGWVTFSFIRDPEDRTRRHPGASAGVLLVAAGAVADATENGLLWLTLDRPADRPDLLSAMRGMGLVKWGLVGRPAAVLPVGALHGGSPS